MCIALHNNDVKLQYLIQSKPQVKPRTTVPITNSPENTPEIYENMSSKGVPLPAGDNVYDDPQESLPRY